jgi:hypothetical protein
MQHDGIRPRDPSRLELKRCSACAVVKRAEGFYESQGRLSSYCKDCQRLASRRTYQRRRRDPYVSAHMRAVDRRRKRRERERLARLDPDRERRAGRAKNLPGWRRAVSSVAPSEPPKRRVTPREQRCSAGRGGMRRRGDR